MRSNQKHKELFFGADPGVTGFLSAITRDKKLILCEPLPAVEIELKTKGKGGKAKIRTRPCEHGYMDLFKQLKNLSEYQYGVVEQLFGAQFAIAAWGLSASYHLILSNCAWSEVSYELLVPLDWQEIAFGGKDSKDKSKSIQTARRNFPWSAHLLENDASHNIADSLNLAGVALKLNP